MLEKVSPLKLYLVGVGHFLLFLESGDGVTDKK